MKSREKIGAVILGAGLSSRMGKPKLLLPWGGSTVIKTIVDTIRSGGIETIVLVTGASHDQLEELFHGTDVVLAHNPDFANNSMIDSLRVGIRALVTKGMDTCLLALGDQPQIQRPILSVIIAESLSRPDQLIIPSYQMHRGHPWIIPGSLWNEILSMSGQLTMRDLINRHLDDIQYLEVQSDSILADLDTPDDYNRQKP